MSKNTRKSVKASWIPSDSFGPRLAVIESMIILANLACLRYDRVINVCGRIDAMYRQNYRKADVSRDYYFADALDWIETGALCLVAQARGDSRVRFMCEPSGIEWFALANEDVAVWVPEVQKFIAKIPSLSMLWRDQRERKEVSEIAAFYEAEYFIVNTLKGLINNDLRYSRERKELPIIGGDLACQIKGVKI